MSVKPIQTERLELIAFEPEAIRHLIQGERDFDLPKEFPSQDDIDGFLSIQHHRMEASPDRRDWMARLMVTHTRQSTGHCGFHGPPAVLRRAEVRYTLLTQS